MTPTTHARNPAGMNLVVIQLSGGNDYLNTVVPYADGRYYDYRPSVGLPAQTLLPLDERVGLNPAMAPVKRLYDEGKVAIIMGVGSPDHSRSHFRSMDIWHTANPQRPQDDGWLGRAASALDPRHRNPVLAVSFGRGLPRALAAPEVSAASVGQLEKYGLFTGIPGARQRDALLDVARRVYSPEAFDDWASHRLLETGRAAQDGADLLRTAAAGYRSTVQYPPHNAIAEHLQGVATVLAGEVGTRIYYTNHGSFDTHGDEVVNHARQWERLSVGLDAFFADLDEQGKREDTVVFVFSEFGRRITDNVDGTDHGWGGVAFLVGDRVRGGLYGDYPALVLSGDGDGDVRPTTDFRAVYASILEQVLDLDPAVAVQAGFAPLSLVRS